MTTTAKSIISCEVVKPYVNRDKFVMADGIKLGKIVFCEGEPFLELCDKDPKRSEIRGSRFILIRIYDLLRIADTDQPPELLTK